MQETHQHPVKSRYRPIIPYKAHIFLVHLRKIQLKSKLYTILNSTQHWYPPLTIWILIQLNPTCVFIPTYKIATSVTNHGTSNTLESISNVRYYQYTTSQLEKIPKQSETKAYS